MHLTETMEELYVYYKKIVVGLQMKKISTLTQYTRSLALLFKNAVAQRGLCYYYFIFFMCALVMWFALLSSFWVWNQQTTLKCIFLCLLIFYFFKCIFQKIKNICNCIFQNCDWWIIKSPPIIIKTLLQSNCVAAKEILK